MVGATSAFRGERAEAAVSEGRLDDEFRPARARHHLIKGEEYLIWQRTQVDCGAQPPALRKKANDGMIQRLWDCVP